VSVGSILGGLSRWGVSAAMIRLLGNSFPWGTFFINISGSLFLGWFMTVMANRWNIPSSALLQREDLHLLVAVGFTGSYTTFSTFQFESHKLLGAGDSLLSAAYVAGSVFLGLLAVRLGVYLGQSS
jgi:CrcB protein